MSSTRCTCCHVCHTSLKTSRREFFPCSECPTIICRQCIELTNQDWDHVNSLKDWSCPRCCGDCPCKRCKNKVGTVSNKSAEKKNKRKRAAATVFEDNGYSTKVRRTEQQTSPKKSTTIVPISKDQRIKELCNKNKKCLDYITRTERLLNLIRVEQGRIKDELESVTIAKVSNSLSSSTDSLSFGEASDSGDSTSGDEYDGALDFSSKCTNNETLLFPVRQDKSNLLA